MIHIFSGNSLIKQIIQISQFWGLSLFKQLLDSNDLGKSHITILQKIQRQK